MPRSRGGLRFIARARTVEQALASVVGTPEGRQAWRAIEAEGKLGKQAFAKAFGLASPEPSEPAPTRGESKLEAMATEYAREHSAPERRITKEQAMAEVVKTAEGAAPTPSIAGSSPSGDEASWGPGRARPVIAAAAGSAGNPRPDPARPRDHPSSIERVRGERRALDVGSSRVEGTADYPRRRGRRNDANRLRCVRLPFSRNEAI